MLYIHKTSLIYKLETFENCKEVKHIIIIITAIIYIYLTWYLLNSCRLLSENPQPPPLKKSTPPFLFTFPLKFKFKKCKSPLIVIRVCFSPLSVNPTKWSNTLKQFASYCWRVVWPFCGVGAERVKLKLQNFKLQLN